MFMHTYDWLLWLGKPSTTQPQSCTTSTTQSSRHSLPPTTSFWCMVHVICNVCMIILYTSILYTIMFCICLGETKPSQGTFNSTPSQPSTTKPSQDKILWDLIELV